MPSNLVLFYGVKSRNGFLSNWYMSDFEVNGIRFCCSEQYMMWSKAMLFRDTEMANKIMRSSDPKTIKAYGRKVRNFDSEIWNSHCIGIMINGLYYKFICNENLLQKFLEFSPDSLFVECSPYDRIWGIGRSVEDVRKTGGLLPSDGKNCLGICLCQVRLRLYNELGR